MNKKDLIKKYDKLQERYGSPNLKSIYGGGKEKNPDMCLVFINPTSRNIATKKDWDGIRRAWLGKKRIWQFLTEVGLFDEKLNNKIQDMKAKDWTPCLCKKVYNKIKKQRIYITDLVKCCPQKGTELTKEGFDEYRKLLLEEIKMVNPKKVILFGNKVSSCVLNKKINVSKYRKTSEELKNKNKTYKCFPVYYPVGNGISNISKAIDDLKYIKNKKGI